MPAIDIPDLRPPAITPNRTVIEFLIHQDLDEYAGIGRHPRRGKYRNEPPLYPHTPWPELEEARFTCWLRTSVPGDEVPLRFRRRDAPPARAREDYHRG